MNEQPRETRAVQAVDAPAEKLMAHPCYVANCREPGALRAMGVYCDYHWERRRVPESAPVAEKVGVTCDGLASLLKAAERAGTVREWCHLAMEWAANADAEIRRLRSLAPEPRARLECTSGCHRPICDAFEEQDDGEGRVDTYCGRCGHSSECHEPLAPETRAVQAVDAPAENGVVK